MSFIYTIEPHPTCNGKVLATAPKPDSWRCLTATEEAFLNIGGKMWTGRAGPGFVHYTLSQPQARDLDAILKAGFRPAGVVWNGTIEPDERFFWHADHEGQEFTRAEALAMIGNQERCNRTLEMDLSPPTGEVQADTPTRDARAMTERQRFKALYREARKHRLGDAELYAAACKLTGETGTDWPTSRLHIAVERAMRPAADMREDLARIVLNGWGSRHGFRSPPMDDPRFRSWRLVSYQAEALRKRLDEAGRLAKDAGGWVQDVLPPTSAINAAPPTEGTERAGAGKLLGAAVKFSRARIGTRTWKVAGATLIIAPPSRSSMGWWQVTLRTGEGQKTVDLFRHRSIAKAWARELICGNQVEAPRLAA